MHDQAAIAATLLRGPDHMPAGLFAGEVSDVLRGLRVHANTISHARLVALEESFPRTRDYLGDGEFNRRSRGYIEAGGARHRALASIGAAFPDWLGDTPAADVARLEWAWLGSYNAAEARALRLVDLAGHDEAALLGLCVRLHPAARIVHLACASAPLIDPAFDPGARALLLTRPEAEVRIFPLHDAAAAALGLACETSPFGNLLAHLAEQHPGGGAAIAELIDAGALERL